MPDLPHIDASSLRTERKRRVAAEAPPLGVGHLLLWFSCCAVYLAVVNSMADRPPGLVGTAIAAFLSLGYGAAWAGMVIFVSRRCGSKIYAIEPGEWLLAILGARLAVEAAVSFVPRWILASPQGVTAAATSVLLALPLLSRTLPAFWKIVVAIMFVLYVTPLLAIGLRSVLGIDLAPMSSASDAVEQIRTPAILFALVLAAGIALWREERYGWLHWSGVIAWMWLLAVGLAAG